MQGVIRYAPEGMEGKYAYEFSFPTRKTSLDGQTDVRDQAKRGSDAVERA